MDTVGQFVVFNIFLVLILELVVAYLHVLAQLVNVQECVANHAAFRQLIFGTILLIGGFDFGLCRNDLELQIVRLDQHIVKRDLLVAVAELLL